MSWSIEEHIGEGRPFPEQVVVYRGETDECMAYVSGEVADRLKAENDKLRKLVRGLHYCSDELTSAECDKCPANDPTDEHLGPTCLKMMEELGIEEDE